MSAIHKLKILPEYFKAVSSGEKKFEIRRNDRGFNVGDFLILREYTNKYTGNWGVFKITYILADPEFLKPGYAALSIKHCEISDLPNFYLAAIREINEGSVQDNET